MNNSILITLIIILIYSQRINAGTDYKKRRQMDGVGLRKTMNSFKTYDEILKHPFDFNLHGDDMKIFDEFLKYFIDGCLDPNKWFESII